MDWTYKYLKSLQIPLGKTKLSVSHTEISGLHFEVRKRRKAFIFRTSRNGKSVSITLGHFPELSIGEAKKISKRLRKQEMTDLLVRSRSKSLSPTLDKFFEDHFKEYSKRRHKNSKAVFAAYRIHIKPIFGHLKLDEINNLHFNNWMNLLTKSKFKPATINRNLIVFGQIINLAETLEMPGAPDRKKLGIKQVQDIPSHTVFLKPGQASRLIEAVKASKNANLADIVSLMLFTGARRSEALHACWEHIDLDGGWWVIPISKNGRPRYIHLSQKALKLLTVRARSATSRFVFENPSTGLPYSCIWHSWNIARTAANLPHLRLHDLRHSFASALVNEGVPLFDVQQLLGHNSIKTTQRYAHLSRERLQASVRCIDSVYS